MAEYDIPDITEYVAKYLNFHLDNNNSNNLKNKISQKKIDIVAHS
jgi:hypothetical protein